MTPQRHSCAVCKSNNVKLYRYYGCIPRDDEIFCKVHAPAGHIESETLVPLCEDSDGMIWGYTSAPQDAIDRFNAMPD